MNSPQVKAYLSRLNKHLSPLTTNEKTEILQEIESRIHDEYALLTNNESQDSELLNILVRMGDPERLARQLRTSTSTVCWPMLLWVIIIALFGSAPCARCSWDWGCWHCSFCFEMPF